VNEPQIDGLELNPAASPQAVEQVEVALGFSFPQDYVDFLLRSNGAEGCIGDKAYLALYSIELLAELNESPSPLPERLVLFGSDGGGEAFTFDRSQVPPRVIQLPFISGDPDDEIDRGGSFTEFLRGLRVEGTLPSGDADARGGCDLENHKAAQGGPDLEGEGDPRDQADQVRRRPD